MTLIASNTSNNELIRANEYRTDLTELERELLTRLESTENRNIESAEIIDGLREELGGQ